MPPKLLVDLETIDLDATAFGIEAIRGRNAQRHEMEMLDRVIHYDEESNRIVGERNVREDEFWARGHFPGRPVFPGVLMIECAGQLCSFFFSERFGSDKVMGFAACEDVKFRGMITPGDVVLALSNSGNTAEILTIVPMIKRLGVPLVSRNSSAPVAM